MRAGRAGYSLGMVLLVISLAMTAVMAYGGTCFYQLSAANRLTSAQEARNLAETALARTIDAILSSPTLGQNLTDTVQVNFSSTDYGIVTFNPSNTSSLPYSTNNFYDNPSKGTAAGWNNFVVPQNAVYLVATGMVGVDAAGHARVKETEECVIGFPVFPFSVAAQGPVNSTLGGLLVAGVLNPSDVFDSKGNINYSKLLPANMMSDSTNGSASNPAVSLKGTNRITGNLDAAGYVSTSQQTIVSGSVQPFSSPVTIPNIDLTTYDPAKNGVTYSTFSSSTMSSPTLSGQYYRNTGDVNISGGLTLNGSVVYIQGNLNVTGGIQGTGALIVTGTTNIAGGTQLSGNNQACVLSGGSVSLTGDANSSSTLQGLVYSKGDVSANGVTVVGAMVAGSGGSGTMTVNNSNMISTPTSGQIDLSTTTTTLPSWGYNSQGQMNVGPYIATVTVSVTQNPDGTMSITVSDGSQSYTTPAASPATAYQQAGRWITCELLNKCGFGYNYSFTPANYPTFDTPPAPLTGKGSKVFGSQISNQYQSPPSGTQTTSVSFSLDLDKFISLEDRMRLLIWRSL